MEEEKSQKMVESERKEWKRGGKDGKVKNLQKMQILFYAVLDYIQSYYLLHYKKREKRDKGKLVDRMKRCDWKQLQQRRL